MGLLIAMIADLDEPSMRSFREYENRVLPLLGKHRGRLERRLRTGDGLTEIHLVSFESDAGYDAFIADPERQGYREILTGTSIAQRVLRVHDV